jgi:hypothetical protein
VQTSCFKKLLDVVCQVSLLAFEVTFGSHDTLLVGAVCFLVVVVEAGSKCDPLGASFCPLLPPLVPFVVPWLVALDGAQQLQLGAIFPSPWTKMTPTASSPVACWAVVSSSSFCSGPSGLRLRPCWSCRPPRREFHAQGLDYASSSPRCAWLHARSLGRLPGQLEGPWTGVKTSEDVVPATGGSVAALCRWPLGRPRLKINIFAWRWREFSACCASVMLRISSS